jgi:uncharacterized protein YxeA
MYNRKVYGVAVRAVHSYLKIFIKQRWTQTWEKVQETDKCVPRIR